MVYIIAAPAHSVSGGPELTHQLCHTLTKQGQTAYMYYYDEDGSILDVSAPDVYDKYATTHITDDSYLKQADTIFIVPEVAVPLLNRYTACKRYLWWLSVDNYLAAYDLPAMPDVKNPDIFRLKNQVDIMHLTQSAYARDFLIRYIGISEDRIHRLSDYLNAEFFRIQIPDAFKQNYIAYNPKKGYKDLKPIIEATPQFRWFPIINMTPQDVGNLLRLSKVYLDFGNHPGKDRIPREATISGCCIITNKKGSAKFYDDIPIPDQYKFEDVSQNPDEIIALIQDIFDNYTTHRQNYSDYCDMIRSEEALFEADTKAILIDPYQ